MPKDSFTTDIAPIQERARPKAEEGPDDLVDLLGA